MHRVPLPLPGSIESGLHTEPYGVSLYVNVGVASGHTPGLFIYNNVFLKPD